ncbi:hypothetical protein GW17_00043559 [Ensete ventricosum]|nr:hypothetical protein GW17_00043559 [Ensete ventricosum]
MFLTWVFCRHGFGRAPREPGALRQRLRLLRQPCDARPVLLVLPRRLPHGAAREDAAAFGHYGVRGQEPEGRGEPVRAVQEEGEAVREVLVPVQEHVLRGAPAPGDVRVRVRLQGARARGDRQGQPRRREGQAAEDLKKTQEY